MVVAAVADLPRAVAGGGCAAAAGVGFPTALADASAKCRPEEAYPVLVMGTQVRGVASLLWGCALIRIAGNVGEICWNPMSSRAMPLLRGCSP